MVHIHFQGIKEWAATHAVPLINEFSQDSAMKIFGGGVKTFFFLVISKEAEVRVNSAVRGTTSQCLETSFESSK